MGLVCLGNWLLSASVGRVGRDGLTYTQHQGRALCSWDCPQNGARNRTLQPSRQKEG